MLISRCGGRVTEAIDASSLAKITDGYTESLTIPKVIFNLFSKVGDVNHYFFKTMLC